VSAAAGVVGARAAAGRPPLVQAHAPDTTTELAPISRIELIPRDVFDPIPHNRFAGLHRLANTIHIRTREGTIRQQLLFVPGGPWKDELGHETARNLRALDFIDPDAIRAHRVGDSVVVTVETHDLWSTAPQLNFESSGGRYFGSVGVTEHNLLGFGKSLSFLYRSDNHGITRLIGYDDPNVKGGRHQLHYEASDGTEGASQGISFGLPFYAQQVRLAYNADAGRLTRVVHLFANGGEAANLDERIERSDWWWGKRVGGGDGVITRFIPSFELFDRRLGPTRAEPGAPPEFQGGEEDIRIRRLAAELVVWHPHYLELTDINRMGRVEDFDIGTTGSIKAGFAPKAFGSTQDEGYMRLVLGAGTAGRFGFGLLGLSASGRLTPEPAELVQTLDVRAYVLPSSNQALVFAAVGVAGQKVMRDFQVVVGGLNGLRAYPVEAVAGHRLWRFNAEHRWNAPLQHWQLLRIGTATFFDAARGWGPGSEGASWYRDAGVGLRFTVPQFGVSDALRIDVAWPIQPTINGRHEAVLTVGSSQAF